MQVHNLSARLIESKIRILVKNLNHTSDKAGARLSQILLERSKSEVEAGGDDVKPKAEPNRKG